MTCAKQVPGEWITRERAIIEYPEIAEAIAAGEVPLRCVCGAHVLRRSEAQALALAMRAQMRECERCTD